MPPFLELNKAIPPACMKWRDVCMKTKKPRRVISTGRGLTMETRLAGMLLHDSGGVCAHGGEQCGDDGDDDFTNPLQGFLGTVFHNSLDLEDSPPALPVREGAVTFKIGIYGTIQSKVCFKIGIYGAIQSKVFAPSLQGRGGVGPYGSSLPSSSLGVQSALVLPSFCAFRAAACAARVVRCPWRS